MSVFLRSSTYYLKIRRGGRQVLRSLKTADHAEALMRAGRLMAALNGATDTAFDTTHLPQTRSSHAPTTLQSLFRDYRQQVSGHVDQGHLRPSYLQEVDGLWRRHLSRFGGRMVDIQLNGAVVDYLNHQRLSKDRRRKSHTLFRKLVSAAGLSIPPQRFQSVLPPKEKRPLTIAQLQRCKEICLAHAHPVAKLIYLAAVTGARIGEIMALGPADIGPDYISITKTKCRKTGAVVACKTRTSRRIIPVSPEILATVQPSLGWQGKEWFPIWRAVRKRAGLGNIGIHVLRHSWATHALGAGITPKAVSLALGHASVTFTEAQYARFLSADHFRGELAAFNR